MAASGRKPRSAGLKLRSMPAAMCTAIPVRPQALPRTLRDLWNRYAKLLHERRCLATNDAELLLQLVNAKAAGDTATSKKGCRRIQSTTTFCAGTATRSAAGSRRDLSLPDFLAAVANERDSFADRMRPDETTCLDSHVRNTRGQRMTPPK